MKHYATERMAYTLSNGVVKPGTQQQSRVHLNTTKGSMYTAERYLQHQREVIDPKGTILKSNMSLAAKYDALVKLDVPFTIPEILDSHPLDWSEQDAHIRRVWLRRMGMYSGAGF